MRNRALFTLLTCMCGLGSALPVAAGTYPDHPIRVVVGFPAGGAADILARIVGQQLTRLWGQQVIVDNRPGAGSTIGADIVAKSTPNGYTLLVISSSHAASAGLYKTTYMPVDSFAPVTLIASGAQALLATPSLQVESISDLIALAKAQPGTLNYGSAGNGSTTHLAGELFNTMAGVKLTHVAYKGGAPALADLIGGQIQLMFLALPPALPHIKAGKVRAIAVTTLKRAQALPQVPAISETVPGYEATNWYGFMAPAGTPKSIIKKLHDDIADVVQSPETARVIAAQGMDSVGNSPAEFTTYLRSEIAKWTQVIRNAGLRPN